MLCRFLNLTISVATDLKIYVTGIGTTDFKACYENTLNNRKIETVKWESSRGVLWKKVFLEISKFTGKHLCQNVIFNKVAGLRPAIKFIKNDTLAQVFPVNFAKFLRTPFLQNTSGRLLLTIHTTYTRKTVSSEIQNSYYWISI